MLEKNAQESSIDLLLFSPFLSFSFALSRKEIFRLFLSHDICQANKKETEVCLPIRRDTGRLPNRWTNKNANVLGRCVSLSHALFSLLLLLLCVRRPRPRSCSFLLMQSLPIDKKKHVRLTRQETYLTSDSPWRIDDDQSSFEFKQIRSSNSFARLSNNEFSSLGSIHHQCRSIVLWTFIDHRSTLLILWSWYEAIARSRTDLYSVESRQKNDRGMK